MRLVRACDFARHEMKLVFLLFSLAMAGIGADVCGPYLAVCNSLGLPVAFIFDALPISAAAVASSFWHSVWERKKAPSYGRRSGKVKLSSGSFWWALWLSRSWWPYVFCDKRATGVWSTIIVLAVVCLDLLSARTKRNSSPSFTLLEGID